jgi:hypothetical protein
MNSLISIETIKAIIKKEFRRNLYEHRSGVYMSKSNLVYVNLNYNTVYVSLGCEKKGIDLELKNHYVKTEKDLLDLIKKFKKARKML